MDNYTAFSELHNFAFGYKFFHPTSMLVRNAPAAITNLSALQSTHPQLNIGTPGVNQAMV